MKQLEILVLTPEMNEEDMYVMKFKKEGNSLKRPHIITTVDAG